MKKLILLFTLISVGTFAQTTSFGSFKLVEQELIFQKVFTQDSITAAALEKYHG